MFAELKSSEDIQKTIIDYLGEDVKDLKRIELFKLYQKIPSEFFARGGIVAYHKFEYNDDIQMRVFHCDWYKVPEIFFDYIQEDMFEPGTWRRQYRSGTKVGSGFVSSCCDMWSQRASRFCPDCGRMMREYTGE